MYHDSHKYSPFLFLPDSLISLLVKRSIKSNKRKTDTVSFLYSPKMVIVYATVEKTIFICVFFESKQICILPDFHKEFLLFPHFNSLLLHGGLKLIQSLQLEANWELTLNCNGFNHSSNQIENCFSVARDGIRQHPWKQVGQPSTYFPKITKSNSNKFISLFDTFFSCNILVCVTSAQWVLG